MAELWVVSTRPTDHNGYGQSTEATMKRVAFLERLGVVLPEHPESYVTWKQLVAEHQVQGKTTHDTRIVAQMFAHGLGTLVTLNPKDFLRYSGLTVLTPEDTLKI